MKQYLGYRAGARALPLIREHGLEPERIAVFAGPAGGPKWFVSVGFDQVLMETDMLRRGPGRVLLVGSSAGGWRCLAMAAAHPQDAYERLRIAYSRNVFTRRDNQYTVSQALRSNVDHFLTDEDIAFVLAHPSFDVAIHVVRSSGPAAVENRLIQGTALLGTALLNVLSPRFMRLCYERILFHTGEAPPSFARERFAGRTARLTEENTREAALATGSLPYIIAGVPDIPGAPRGVYRDGGLIDYQLNQDYAPPPGHLTLFFHYQERIVPGWLDKRLTWRTAPPGSTDHLLQVFPGPDFLRLLPDGRLPDRSDFVDFVDNPGQRIRRWDEVSATSRILGEEFMNHIESGQIRKLVKPLRERKPA
jgi:hypothetical protein